MSFTGNQKNSRLNTIYDKANGAVQVGFPTITLAANSVVANSNTDILNIRGAGFTVTTSTNQRTLTIATNSDLRVSQNSALMAANNWIVTPGSADATSMNGIAWSPELGLFVVVGTSGSSVYCASSPDGVIWTRRTLTAAGWKDVCWSPELGLFVAVASFANEIATSPDGITWTLRTKPVSNPYQDAIWAKELGLFVVVCGTGGADDTKQVATSPDGINWTSRSTPAGYWVGVAWSPELGILVAVSYTTGTAMTSPDGITWTLGASNPGASSVAWSPELGMFVSLGSSIKYSYDGLTWNSATPATTGTSGADAHTIVWVPQFRAFVATQSLGSPRARISFDGRNWSSLTGMPTATWANSVWSPELGILVVVSAAGTTGTVAVSRPVGLWGAINTRLTRQQVMSRISLGV